MGGENMYKKWTIIDDIRETINEEDFKLFDSVLLTLYEYYKIDNILYGSNDYIVIEKLILNNNQKPSYQEIARTLGYRSKTSISRSVEKIEKNILDLIKHDKKYHQLKKYIKLNTKQYNICPRKNSRA